MRRIFADWRRSSDTMSSWILGSTFRSASCGMRLGYGRALATSIVVVLSFANMGRYVPSREEFRAYASRGNLVPVYREIVADTDTPVSAFAKLGGGPFSFLLESVIGGEKWAAYSFIGVSPLAIFEWRRGSAHITWFEGGAA